MSKILEKTEKEEIVNELEVVNIGGVDQYILERGNNKNNPVILFLHGGPGMAQIGYMPKYQKELEKYFVVVNWDQRGSGLSYYESIPKESMNVEQFINDTIEVTNYLRRKFNKKKIYLIGHSWGTLLGMKVIYNYPELFYSYIGIGQITNMWMMERVCYDFIKEMALKANNKLALQELDEIGTPPYDKLIEGIQVTRKWVAEYDGTIKNGDLGSIIFEGMKDSKYYNDEDIKKWEMGSGFSAINLIDEIINCDLFDEVKEVKIPVTLFGGRYDYTTPSTTAVEYIEKLKAPHKEFIWFENSAHLPMVEEYEKFSNEVIRVFKK